MLPGMFGFDLAEADPSDGLYVIDPDTQIARRLGGMRNSALFGCNGGANASWDPDGEAAFFHWVSILGDERRWY